MQESKIRRIAIDAVVTFALTFGVFWWKSGGTKDTTTLVGIILIWIVGAVLAAWGFESWKNWFAPKVVPRQQK